ncbi:MAG TPA: glycosyltransferase, partial [Gammaproteobacteria bacterium]
MSEALQRPILVMAGGTGGHVFPALAVAERLRERGENIVWLGTHSGIEARVVPAADFAIEWLSVQGLRGKGLASLMLAPLRLLRACWQALGILRRTRPKAVLGMGGFVSGPGGLMAWLLHIPLFVHEQNSVIGLTNRILSRLAVRSYFAFPQAAAKITGGECIGNPVRADFAGFDDPARRL